MKQYSTKRQSIQRNYLKVLNEILEERPNFCEGCGRSGVPLTPSHRIPRSRRSDLIADRNNIDLYCGSCHTKVEAGKYDQLANGIAVLDYIEQADPEYYRIKTILKQEDFF